MPTPRQAKALRFIHTYIVDHDGAAPSYHEIAQVLGVRGRNSVRWTILGLIDQGFIRKHPGSRRSMEVIKLLPDMQQSGIAPARHHVCPHCGEPLGVELGVALAPPPPADERVAA